MENKIYPIPEVDKCPNCNADLRAEESVKRVYTSKHGDREPVVDYGEMYELTDQYRFSALVDGRFYELLDDSDSCVSCGQILNLNVDKFIFKG